MCANISRIGQKAKESNFDTEHNPATASFIYFLALRHQFISPECFDGDVADRKKTFKN